MPKNPLPVESWPVDRPQPYPNNPRRNDKAVAKVAASIEKFGWRQPIVVDEAGVIIIGHTRHKAAQRLGLATIPVHVAKGLSETEARALRLADNRSAADAEWDDALLLGELRALESDDFALALTGFDDLELRSLFAEPEDEKPDEEAFTPKPPKQPVTKRGDRIELGKHVLYCGDATAPEDVAALMDGDRASCLFSDPPYAVYGSSSGIAEDITDDKMVRPFFAATLRALVQSAAPFAHVYLCCDWRSWASWWEVAKGSGIAPKNMIVWSKNGAGLGANYAMTHELLFFGSVVPMRDRMTQKIKGIRPVYDSNVWAYNRVAAAGASEGREHNAQKPLALVTRALENSSAEGDIVADFFGGSGTTLIAAEQTGRSCRMMEIEPGYCDVIVERWERETGRKAVRP